MSCYAIGSHLLQFLSRSYGSAKDFGRVRRSLGECERVWESVEEFGEMWRNFGECLEVNGCEELRGSVGGGVRRNVFIDSNRKYQKLQN